MHAAGPQPIVEVEDLRKRYGDRAALDGVSFSVVPGEVVGLLGPNGAGKTTTLSILATIVRPDAGRVAFDGGGAAGVIGLVPQSLALYPTLSAAENVWHFARVQGLSKSSARRACAEVLEEVGLADRANSSAQSLSGGLQRRLNLACGLVHRPRLLLLDEPTVGVDLESREQILALVSRRRDAGTAVIYSTHYMEEAERICDRVLLIDRGRLVSDGTVEDLIRRAGQRAHLRIAMRGRLSDEARDAVARRFDVRTWEDGALTLELASASEVEAVLGELAHVGGQVVHYSLHTPNLADAFLALTGRPLGEAS